MSWFGRTLGRWFGAWFGASEAGPEPEPEQILDGLTARLELEPVRSAELWISSGPTCEFTLQEIVACSFSLTQSPLGTLSIERQPSAEIHHELHDGDGA